MELIFITHSVSNPITGGQIYNDVLLNTIEKTGVKVYRFEGGLIWGRSFMTLPLVAFDLLIKIIKAPKNTVLMFDSDYFSRYAIALYFARFVRKLPCIGMIHHFNFLTRKPSLGRSIVRVGEALSSKMYTHVIANTPFSKRIFCELVGKQKTPLFLLEPLVNVMKPISVSPRKLSSKTINLLFVGTIENRKNLDTLFLACSKLSIPYHLKVIGKIVDLTYYSKLQIIIDTFNLHHNVSFVGSVDAEELRSSYESADIFTLVSRMEGYGMVYAEAMCFGLPIVGSKAGAVPDLVLDGENGILANPEDCIEILDAIYNVISPRTYKKLSMNNIEKSKLLPSRNDFIANCDKTWQNLIENLVK